MDLQIAIIRSKYTEMIYALMQRIEAECGNPNTNAAEIAALMASYADLVRATSGGEA